MIAKEPQGEGPVGKACGWQILRWPSAKTPVPCVHNWTLMKVLLGRWSSKSANLKIQKSSGWAWGHQVSPLKAELSLAGGKQQRMGSCWPPVRKHKRKMLNWESPAVCSQQENREPGPATMREWILPSTDELGKGSQPWHHLDSSCETWREGPAELYSIPDQWKMWDNNVLV